MGDVEGNNKTTKYTTYPMFPGPDMSHSQSTLEDSFCLNACASLMQSLIVLYFPETRLDVTSQSEWSLTSHVQCLLVVFMVEKNGKGKKKCVLTIAF